MAIIEQRVLVSILHHIEKAAFEVKWEDRVIKDGVVIAATPFRTAFGDIYNVAGVPNFTGAIGPDASIYFASIEAEIKGGALNMLNTERVAHAADIAAKDAIIAAKDAEIVALKS